MQIISLHGVVFLACALGTFLAASAAIERQTTCLLQSRTGALQKVRPSHLSHRLSIAENLNEAWKGGSDMNASEATGGDFAKVFNRHAKGLGIHKWIHYFTAYNRHLSQFIGKEVHVVEIGIQSGGSLQMWRDVFGPKAQVYGIDIDPRASQFADDRIKVFIGDQSNTTFWADFRKQVPHVDILIDDGGHKLDDLLTTLGEMLPHLSSNGVYMAEDLVGFGTEYGWDLDNKFWEHLTLQAGFNTSENKSAMLKSYQGMSNLVGSIHIYPWLLVLERTSDVRAMVRQLGQVDPNQVALRAATVKSNAPTGQELQTSLQNTFPTFSFRPVEAGHLSLADQVGQLGPEGLLVTSWHDQSTMPLPSEGVWGSNLDSFLHALTKQFQALHEWDQMCWPVCKLSSMQSLVESINVYPSQLLIKHVDQEGIKIVATQKGDQWLEDDYRFSRKH